LERGEGAVAAGEFDLTGAASGKGPHPCLLRIGRSYAPLSIAKLHSGA
jgi:hypothetical protein